VGLLELWQPKLDQLISGAEWLSEVELLVRGADGAVERIAGADCTATRVMPAPPDMPPRRGAAAVRRSDRMLVLDPLVVFDVPRLQAEGESPESDPVVQAYARREPLRMLYTPFGAEFVMQSLGTEALTEAFQKLFDFDALRREARQRGWVRDFAEDIKKEARRMVGRAEESDRLGGCFLHRRGSAVARRHGRDRQERADGASRVSGSARRLQSVNAAAFSMHAMAQSAGILGS
jgi:hypothetical protein